MLVFSRHKPFLRVDPVILRGWCGRDCLHKLYIDEELNPFWSDIEYAFLVYGFLPLWLEKRFKCIEVLSKWRLVLYARTRAMIRYQNFWYSKQNKLASCDHLIRVLPIWEKLYTHCLGQDILLCAVYWNNYSPQCRLIVVNIYLAASRLVKFPPVQCVVWKRQS